MARDRSAPSRRAGYVMDGSTMDDLVERNDARDLLPLQRCRLLLGDEAIGLTDDDIDAIRRHAQAMAHTLVEVFLHQQHAERE